MKNAKNEFLENIFIKYSTLPDFIGINFTDVNTKSNFGDYLINAAATRGDIGEVSCLLKLGADINSQGEGGFTPLHNSVEQGHLNVVDFLLKKSAKKDIKNFDGNTPYDLAVILNEVSIQKTLDR